MRIIPISLVAGLVLSICIGSPAQVNDLAGPASGFADGTGTADPLDGLNDLAADSARTRQRASKDRDALTIDSRTIRKITPARFVTASSGTADTSGGVDRTSGNLYVADQESIRQIAPAGMVPTLAGGTFGSAGDPGTATQLEETSDSAIDSARKATSASAVFRIAPDATDACASATIIPSLPFTEQVDTRFALRDAGEPVSCQGQSKSVWYRYTPGANGSVTVSTFTSDYDTVLAAYTGPGCGTLTPVACNDQGGVDNQSLLSFNVTAGATYWIQVTSWLCTRGGTLIFNACASAPLPPITAANSCPGATSSTASVPDAGAGATYDWTISNGTVLSGQRSPSITYTAGATSSSVTLGVMIRRPAGCTTFSTATLSSLGAPIMTAPATASPSSAGNAASVPDAGTGAVYNWTINNGAITAGAGTRSITFTSGASGATDLSVAVTGAGCSASNSSTRRVCIIDPTITAAAVCSNSSGNTASVPDAGPGAIYRWSFANFPPNASITSGQGTRTITYSVGAQRTTLSVTIVNSAGCVASSTKVADAAPYQIFGPGPVEANSTGNLASVGFGVAGTTYAWTISGGTITTGGGTSQINFSAGPSGIVRLDVTVTGPGCPPQSSSASVPILSTAAAPDSCASPRVMSTLPFVDRVNSCSASRDGTDPLDCGSPTGGTLWYEYMAASTGTIRLNASGGFSLAVYTGSCGSFTKVSAACGQSITLDATAGQTYRILLSTTSNSPPTSLVFDACAASPAATITVPPSVCEGSSGQTASVPDAGAGATYEWFVTNGIIQSGTNTSTVTFAPLTGASSDILLGVTVRSASGCSASASATVPVNGRSSITAPGVVAPSSANTASVSASVAATTFTWTITGGTITAGQGTRTINFTAGASGTVVIGVTVTAPGCTAFSDSARICITTVLATITAPAATCPGSTGNTASVPDGGAGAIYSWGISGGTITGGAGTRMVTFALNETAGSARLFVTVADAAGCAVSGSATVLAPGGGGISAPQSNYAATSGNVAFVPDAGEGSTYAWTIDNGTITGGGGTRQITFGTGSSGRTTLTVVVTAPGCAPRTFSRSVDITVAPTDTLVPPPAIVATALSTSSVSVLWTGVAGAVTYELFRSNDNSPFTLIAATSSTTTTYTDTNLTANTSYRYKVRAVNSSGTTLFSPTEVATTIVFSNDPLMAGQVIMAAHIIELRTAVNAMRRSAGLGLAPFTNDPLTPGTPVRRIHITELRSALASARIGLTPVNFNDNTLTVGSSVMRAVHVQQIREGVK